MSYEDSTITYVDVSVTLRISSEPVTEDDLGALKTGMEKVLEQVFSDPTDPQDIGEHDVDLSSLVIDRVEQHIERHWDLKAKSA
jgi:hypothetical protein